MALTITKPFSKGGRPNSPVFVDVFNCVMDASYPTGGEAFDIIAQAGMEDRTLVSVQTEAFITSSGAPTLQRYQWNATSKKIMANLANGGGEVADTTDLSAHTVVITVVST